MYYIFKSENHSHQDRYFDQVWAGVVGYNRAVGVWDEPSCQKPDNPSRAWFQNKAAAFYRMMVHSRYDSLTAMVAKAAIKHGKRK